MPSFDNFHSSTSIIDNKTQDLLELSNPVLYEKNEAIAPQLTEVQDGDNAMANPEPMDVDDKLEEESKIDEREVLTNTTRESSNEQRKMMSTQDEPLMPGELCVIRDVLSRPQLNGARGIVRKFDVDKQRFEIHKLDGLLSGQTLSLAPANLNRFQSDHPAHCDFLYRVEIRPSGDLSQDRQPPYVTLLEISPDSSAHAGSQEIPNIDLAMYPPVGVPGFGVRKIDPKEYPQYPLNSGDIQASIPQIDIRLLLQRKSDGLVIPFPNDFGHVIPETLGKDSPSQAGEISIGSQSIVVASGTRPDLEKYPHSFFAHGLPADAQRLPLSNVKCTLKWSVVPSESDSSVDICFSPYPVTSTGTNTSLLIQSIDITMAASHTDPEVPHTEEMCCSLFNALSIEAAGLFAPDDSGICGCPGSCEIIGNPSHQRPWIQPEAVGLGAVNGSCWHTPGHRRCGWSPARWILNRQFIFGSKDMGDGVIRPALLF